jgi:UDP-N-acetyl-D-mannosaminuronate dehydrogenase
LEEIKRVLIIGLGQLGLPVARYVREKGFDTYGFDISIAAMKKPQKIDSIKDSIMHVYSKRDGTEYYR